MSLSWRLNRLRRMGWPEVMYRAKQAIRTVCESRGIGRARPGPRIHESVTLWSLREARDFDGPAYAAAADAILAGQFRVFALRPADLGFPPIWNRDPRTGVNVPLLFGKQMDYRDEAVVGNIKYLWEPNRHLELVTLAQAWHLTRQEKYAAGCRVYLDSWFDQCPYPFGANWSSSLELAIRLVNWSFAWQLLGRWDAVVFSGDDGQRFRERWLECIYQHCHFIARFPSLHSSANNHRLGEQLGLFVASTTWPLWRESSRWRNAAWQEFQKESLLQNWPDGVNREQSTWYQHEVMDMMMIAGLIARASGRDFDEAFWLRLEAMCEFIASVMDVAGQVPAIGDADDAVIVRLTGNSEHDVYRSLLAAGAVVFGRVEFKTKAAKFDDKARWLLGDRAADEFNEMKGGPGRLPVRREYRDGGYYILGSDFETDREIRIIADAGPLGYLAIAAHGHADALSFTLSAGGSELLIDPGTYVYQGNSVWREYFRGSAGHNTLVIDNAPQSVSGGPFLWVRHARAHCDLVAIREGKQDLSAWHDGYRRFGVQSHRRTLSYDPGSCELTVLDMVESNSGHEVKTYWHFAPECIVSLSGNQVTVARDRAVCSLEWLDGCHGELIRGREDPPLGWQSKCFDCKTPANTLVVSHVIEGNWQGVTRLRIRIVSN